jgi:hypothetical protein
MKKYRGSGVSENGDSLSLKCFIYILLLPPCAPDGSGDPDEYTRDGSEFPVQSSEFPETLNAFTGLIHAFWSIKEPKRYNPESKAGAAEKALPMNEPTYQAKE